MKELYDLMQGWLPVPDEPKAKTPIAAAELNGKVAQISDVVWVVRVGCKAHHTEDIRSRPLRAIGLVHLGGASHIGECPVLAEDTTTLCSSLDDWNGVTAAAAAVIPVISGW